MADAPTTAERHARDQAMMADLRAHGGRTSAGQVLVILTVVGAKTGKRRDLPVSVSEDGTDLIVAASAGGQAAHPQWYRDLLAHPEIDVEYLGESFAATATTVENGPERDRLFQQMAEKIIGLNSYQDRCRDTRQIPVIRIRRR